MILQNLHYYSSVGLEVLDGDDAHDIDGVFRIRIRCGFVRHQDGGRCFKDLDTVEVQQAHDGTTPVVGSVEVLLQNPIDGFVGRLTNQQPKGSNVPSR